MTPDKKEKVLLALKEHGMFTLMSGDGANDVGALKQAHVGIALLSGFGGTNAEKLEVVETKKKDEVVVAKANEAEVEKPKLNPKEERARVAKERQEELMRDIAERKARGESWAEWNAMKEMMKKERDRQS
jgi:cation-transporting ATPase 13A1